MRPIWKGSISFGLVTIPVQIVNATNEAEKISFKMLRKKDLSPIRYKRVAEVDSKEVEWGEIVKGYEYEKGQFVIMEEKDFDKVDLKGTDSIEILDFVDEAEVEPIYFYKPYYIEPLKGGGPAYGLLRDVLADTERIGIAKVVIRSRQHLAAVKAKDELLLLELMHFASEIAPAENVRVPETKGADKRTMEIAKTLVEQMTSKWEPERYVDEYGEKMRELIDRKIEAGGRELPETKKTPTKSTNVIDLMAVLQESLKGAKKAGKSAKADEADEAAEATGRRVKTRAPAAKRRGVAARKTTKRAAHKQAA